MGKTTKNKPGSVAPEINVLKEKEKKKQNIALRDQFESGDDPATGKKAGEDALQYF